MTAKDFIDGILADTKQIGRVSIPPFATGQTSKSYLLEDLRCFLCTAISADIKKKEKSSKPIRDEKIVQELILYYHIIGYSDEAAKEKMSPLENMALI